MDSHIVYFHYNKLLKSLSLFIYFDLLFGNLTPLRQALILLNDPFNKQPVVFNRATAAAPATALDCGVQIQKQSSPKICSSS